MEPNGIDNVTCGIVRSIAQTRHDAFLYHEPVGEPSPQNGGVQEKGSSMFLVIQLVFLVLIVFLLIKSVYIVFLVLIVFLLIKSVYIVEQQNVAIIERLGKFNRTAPAGLRFCIPVIERIATRVDLRTHQEEFAIDAKTRDNVTVTMSIAAPRPRACASASPSSSA